MMRSRIMLIFVFLAIAIYHVDAFGVSPANKEISVFPGETYTDYFRIFNSQNINLTVELEVPDEFSSRIAVLNNTIFVRADERFKPVYFDVTIPESSPDESFTARINAKEVRLQAGTVMALININYDFTVNVARTGKRILPEISYDYARDGFVATIRNTGSENIDDAWLEININGVSFSSEHTGLGRRKSHTFFIERPDAVAKGIWTVHAVFFFDEKETEIKKNVSVGQPGLEILGISSQRFVLGQINEIVIIVESDWNTKLSVRGNAVILSNGTKFDEIALNEQEVLGRGQLRGYLNTAGMKPGQYRADVVVLYDGLRTAKTIDVKVTEGSFESDAREVRDLGKRFSAHLISLACVIVIFVFVLLTLLKKTREKRTPKK